MEGLFLEVLGYEMHKNHCTSLAKLQNIFLQLSLVVDAEIWAVNRMDKVIHPRPYASNFLQSVVHTDFLSQQLYLEHNGYAL